jgi:putative MATE family efflux protein
METQTIILPRRGLLASLRAAVAGEQKDFTTGEIKTALFMLAVPMILEMVMESLFAVVDVFYVSRVGVDAIVVVGLTESMMMIIYGIAVGLAMAATAFVARRTGEKKPREAAQAAVQALYLTVMVSAPISVVGAIFAPNLLAMMGGSPKVIAEGTTFMRVLLGGNLVVMFLFMNNAVFRGAGDAAISMRVLWLATGLNIVLCPIFIFGYGPIPALGVTGAAVATTLGRSIGVMYQVWNFSSNRSVIRISRADLAPDFRLIGEMFRVSLGGMGQFLIHSASWIFVVRILSSFGGAAVAGYTIAIRVIIFTILPAFGLANAAATLVGQNLGARQPERAEQSVWTAAFYNMIFLTSVSVVFFIFAPQIISFFQKDPEVITVGVRCLRVICLGYILYGYGMVIGQSFNGAGDTRTPTRLNLICFWIYQIPTAYFLAKTMKLGPTGVFIAQASSFCLTALLSIYVFRQGKWKVVKI